MFRNNEYPNIKTSVNCLLSDGGLGDLLCALIPVNYILKNHPWLNLLIWVPDYMVEFTKHVLPKQNNIVRGYTEAEKKYNSNLICITTKWLNRQHTPMRTHPVDYAYHVLLDKHIDNPKEKNYLKINPNKISISKFNLPEKYVVLQAYAAETVKRLPGHVLNNIAKYCIIKGYKVVYVGKAENKSGYGDIGLKAQTSDNLDFSLGIDLTNKTSLLELAKVIENSKCFIGMDGGITHLAGFTNTPIVAGYTLASPEHLMPYREGVKGFKCHPIVPDESLGCRFCQTNMNFIYGIDFRDCYYKDYQCVKMLNEKMFIEKLEGIL